MSVALQALHAALKEAATIVEKTGGSAHIFVQPGVDEPEVIADVFRPVCEQREQWIRVLCDGSIEEGRTGRKLGTLGDFGL